MKKTVKNIQQEEVNYMISTGIIIKNQKAIKATKSSHEIF